MTGDQRELAVALALGLAMGSALPARAGTPEPRTLLKRALEAQGGLSRFETLADVSASGHETLVGLSLPVTVSWRSPDLYKKVNPSQGPSGLGEKVEAFDGSARWMKVALRVQTIPAELSTRWPLEWVALYPLYRAIENGRSSAEYVGKRNESGAAFYLVRFRDKQDATLWFDARSRLLRRIEVTVRTPQGAVEIEVRILEYRKVDDLRLPSRLEVQVDRQPARSFDFDQIRLDTGLGAADFARPVTPPSDPLSDYVRGGKSGIVGPGRKLQEALGVDPVGEAAEGGRVAAGFADSLIAAGPQPAPSARRP